MTADLIPEHPHDAGIKEQVPELGQIEGARLLANEARLDLLRVGFTESEILEWALTYISIEHSGDLDSFLVWIREMEQRQTDVA